MASIRDGEVQMSFAVNESLKNEFLKYCKDNDSSASREFRELMRRVVRDNKKKHNQGILK
jgi:hypothetical protein